MRANSTSLGGESRGEVAPVIALDSESLAYLRQLALGPDDLKAGVVLVTRDVSSGEGREAPLHCVPSVAGGGSLGVSANDTIHVALGTMEGGHKGVATRLGLVRPIERGRVIEGANFHIEDECVAVEGISSTFGEVTTATLGEGSAGLRRLSAFLTTFWRALRS